MGDTVGWSVELHRKGLFINFWCCCLSGVYVYTPCMGWQNTSNAWAISVDVALVDPRAIMMSLDLKDPEHFSFFPRSAHTI